MEQSSTPAGTSTAPAKKSRTGLYAIIAVVVIIIVAVVALYATGYLGGSAKADITINDDGKCTPTGDASCNFASTTFTATGKTVTWKNAGTIDHTVTFNATGAPGTPPSNSGAVGGGATFSATFTTAGTYRYYCSYHTWMIGTVTIP